MLRPVSCLARDLMGYPGSWLVPNAGRADRAHGPKARAEGTDRRSDSGGSTGLEQPDHRRVPGQRGQGRRPLRGGTLLLLHTVGARTGQPAGEPGGVPGHRGRRRGVRVEGRAPPPTRTGTTTWSPTPRSARRSAPRPCRFVARVAEGAERDRIWAAQKTANPGFADYERKTTRQIPVVILEPAS